jgi:hypothetical protein
MQTSDDRLRSELHFNCVYFLAFQRARLLLFARWQTTLRHSIN